MKREYLWTKKKMIIFNIYIFTVGLYSHIAPLWNAQVGGEDFQCTVPLTAVLQSQLVWFTPQHPLYFC